MIDADCLPLHKILLLLGKLFGEIIQIQRVHMFIKNISHHAKYVPSDQFKMALYKQPSIFPSTPGSILAGLTYNELEQYHQLTECWLVSSLEPKHLDHVLLI